MPLISIPQAAERMGVTEGGARTALKRAYDAGEVRLERIGKVWAIDEADLDAYIKLRGGVFKPGGQPKKTEAVGS